LEKYLRLIKRRIGRRPVFLLAIYGLFLANLWSLVVLRFWRYLPIVSLWESKQIPLHDFHAFRLQFFRYILNLVPVQRLLWLNTAFTLMGGGEAVVTMMFYAIGSDVTPQERR
jgi:hypothetical protein